jgi:Na+/glutamate symporter
MSGSMLSIVLGVVQIIVGCSFARKYQGIMCWQRGLCVIWVAGNSGALVWTLFVRYSSHPMVRSEVTNAAVGTFLAVAIGGLLANALATKFEVNAVRREMIKQDAEKELDEEMRRKTPPWFKA